jgi:hypothetical protein
MSIWRDHAERCAPCSGSQLFGGRVIGCSGSRVHSTPEEIASASPSLTSSLPCRTLHREKDAANNENRYFPNAVCYASHADSRDKTQSRASGLKALGLYHHRRFGRRLRALLGAVHRGSQRPISESENCFLPNMHRFTSFSERPELVSSSVWSILSFNSLNLMFATSASCRTAHHD